jgi:hypothetical protein
MEVGYSYVGHKRASGKFAPIELGSVAKSESPLLAGKVSIGRCACAGELNGRAFHAMVSLLK